MTEPGWVWEQKNLHVVTGKEKVPVKDKYQFRCFFLLFKLDASRKISSERKWQLRNASWNRIKGLLLNRPTVKQNQITGNSPMHKLKTGTSQTIIDPSQSEAPIICMSPQKGNIPTRHNVRHQLLHGANIAPETKQSGKEKG